MPPKKKDEEEEMVTKEEYDSLVKQVNALQTSFINMKNTQDDVLKQISPESMIPKIIDVVNWHTHSLRGEMHWDRIPPAAQQILQKFRQQQIQAQQQAQAQQHAKAQVPPTP